MSTTTDLDAIRTRFRTEWAQYGITTLYDNAPEEAVDLTQAFVRFGINPSATVRETFGSTGVHAREGMVWLQIFIPLAEGVKEAYGYADLFATIFRNWRADGLDLACGVEQIRQVPNGDQYQVNVMVPYRSRSV